MYRHVPGADTTRRLVRDQRISGTVKPHGTATVTYCYLKLLLLLTVTVAIAVAGVICFHPPPSAITAITTVTTTIAATIIIITITIIDTAIAALGYPRGNQERAIRKKDGTTHHRDHHYRHHHHRHRHHHHHCHHRHEPRTLGRQVSRYIAFAESPNVGLEW